LVFRYTEYIGNKYNLFAGTLKIGSSRMKNLGICRGTDIVYNRRLIKDPGHVMTTIIHELCHIREYNHGRDFWQLYEDICLSEGILLRRVLGNKISFRDIKGQIPYRWDIGIDFFTDREKRAIDKHMRRNKSFAWTFSRISGE
jgi:hypothetical protein